MITAELLRRDLAEVTITPSILRRILYRERTETRFAVRVIAITGGFVWSWDDTGRRIADPRILVELDRAERAARRPRDFNAVDPIESVET